jgi:hypothetical protein
MAQKPNKQTSLRNPLAALATATEKLGQSEKGLNRAQRNRETRKLRELARKEPAPKQ